MANGLRGRHGWLIVSPEERFGKPFHP
jgi:hypothetical protein